MVDKTDVTYIIEQMKDMTEAELSRGHISDRGAALIRQIVEAPTTSNEDGLGIARFTMPLHGGVNLIRLFVMTGPSGEHILYVPTQPNPPGDRTFYETNSLKRVKEQLVEFLGKEGGLNYMKDLVPEDATSARAYFEELSRLPSSWTDNSIILTGVSGDTYAHQIQKIVNR